MFYLDSHCHINDDKFNNDLIDTLNRMVENKVLKCMIVCVNPKEYEKTLLIKHNDIQIKKAIGIYPEDALLSQEEKEEYYKHFNEVDAIGEIGLDYHWYKDTKEEQKKLFIEQIEMANKIDKPIIVHTREACQDTVDILKQHPCKGVIHCFSESAEIASILSKLGYYISLSGTITFMKKEKAESIIKAIPLDKLLIETDSPYLSPVPNRGKRNEPSNVVYVAKYISEVLNINLDDLLNQINNNYEVLFGK